MKKIISILFILVLLFTMVNPIYASEANSDKQVIEEALQVSAESVKEININSRAVLVLDRASNTVIYEKNGYTKRAMASTTKIMSAIVILENANLEDIVEVSKLAGGTGGSRLGLKAGDKISVNDLLYGLMLRSRQ